MTSKHQLSRSKISSQPNWNGIDMNIHTSTLYEWYLTWVQISLSAVKIYSEISAVIGFLGLVWKPCPSLNALPPSKKKLHSTSLHNTLALILSLAVLKTNIYAKSCSTGDLPNIQISWKKTNINFWFNIYSLKIA